jgi:hypothetical protein
LVPTLRSLRSGTPSASESLLEPPALGAVGPLGVSGVVRSGVVVGGCPPFVFSGARISLNGSLLRYAA